MSELVFSETSPEQINGLWPYLSQGIDETYKRWQDKVGWVPMSFYEAIKKDRARVSFIYDNGTRIGFLIHRIFWEEFSGQKYMHIWFAYLYPEYRFRLKEYLYQGLEYLLRRAKTLDCRFMEMDSLRTGWSRLLKDFNMKPRRVVYRKEI